MPYELLLDICYMPLRIALFIDNYDFMTTCVQYFQPCTFVRHFPVHFPVLQGCKFSRPVINRL